MITRHMTQPAHRTALWWNSFALLGIMLLALGGRFLGFSPSALVFPPLVPHSFYLGLLTHVMQVLCVAPPILCLFCSTLLPALKANPIRDRFFTASTFVWGCFWVNETFRVHILLINVGIPKWATISVYGLAVLIYALAFRDWWRSTPYGVFIAAMGLFAWVYAMDAHALGHPRSDLWEGIPKTFAFLNLALYFGLVCRQEILKSLRA